MHADTDSNCISHRCRYYGTCSLHGGHQPVHGARRSVVDLNAGFLAVVQVAVYIDAIAIMIIVVVMLTRHSMGIQDRQKNKTWWVAVIAALMLFGGLVLMFTQTPLLAAEAPALTLGSEAMLEELGLALVDVDRYIVPFEVASVLLLAALVGSIIVAWPGRKSQDQEDES